MGATILRFPSSRAALCVRVEREADGDGWIVLARACGWLHGERNAAIRDAHEIAAGFGVTVRSS
jgi:hypothetical protein